jgi:hypothetical protein
MPGPVEGFAVSIVAVAAGFLALWGLSKLLDRLVC